MKVRYLSHRHLWLLLLTACILNLSVGVTDCEAVDLGVPVLSEPLQQEKFFDTDRLTIRRQSSATTGVLEPQVGLSHAAREDDASSAGKQTTQRIHGEAGGKLNLMENLSLTAIARIPLYTRETKSGDRSSSADDRVASDLLGQTGDLSWRSEVGVKLGTGVDLNLFYDTSTFGRMDKPGVEDREDKFGTRFIIHFK